MLAYAFGTLDWAVNVSSHVFLQDCNESGYLLCYLVIKYDKVNTVCYYFLFSQGVEAMETAFCGQEINICDFLGACMYSVYGADETEIYPF